MKGGMGQQNSCKTSTGVHSMMHLVHANQGLATITCVCPTLLWVHYPPQNLPEDEVLRHGKEAVEAHFKSKFKEVCENFRVIKTHTPMYLCVCLSLHSLFLVSPLYHSLSPLHTTHTHTHTHTHRLTVSSTGQS